MQIVTFDQNGLAVSAQMLPANMRVVDDATPVYADGRRMVLTPEGIGLIWDLRGQACYGGEAGRTGTRVPDDPALIGKSWDDLASLTSEINPFGFLPQPRAETAAEKKAREKVEADAAAANELDRIANLTVPLFAIRKVFRDTKAEDGASYLAKVEEAKAAGHLSDDAYEAITMLDPVKRSSPYIGEFKTVFGFSDPEIDALFLAADAVPV